MATEFKLPDLGEGVETGDVISVLVSVGDTIEVDQGVIELETDKALIEVPSEFAGTIASVNVSEGDSIPPGTVLITIDATTGATEAGGSSTKPEQIEEKTPEATVTEVEEASPAPKETQPTADPATSSAPVVAAPLSDDVIPAAPATRRFARELGVNLQGVPGTGPGGRIVKDDVLEHVRTVVSGAGAASGPGPEPDLPDFGKWGTIERQPMPKIRQVIARNLSTAWTHIPHVTQFGSADFTELEAFRQRNKNAAETLGAKLTPTVLVLKAIVTALKTFPQFNASLDLEAHEVILKKYINLGIAVDTERGLLVPIIKNVDRKDIYEIAGELGDLGERTRSNRVTLEELRGGTFTVTNLGSLGGGAFTPIINHPEVAILGIGRSREEAVVVDGRIEPRLMMPLCLSYDHRVIDGADGARFMSKLIESLQNPEHMLLGG